jgi:hypothetical protein
MEEAAAPVIAVPAEIRSQPDELIQASGPAFAGWSE